MKEITFYRNKDGELICNCEGPTNEELIICKDLFLHIEKSHQWNTNPTKIKDKVGEPIKIQSITFTI